MVDLHSHIIWGVDDGSKSREMTLNMLNLAIEGGTNKIVCTPHYMPGYYEYTLDEIKKRQIDLKKLILEEGLDIETYIGQEVYYTNNILENYEKGYIGTINNSRYMLIEFDMRSFSSTEVLENLYELQLKGIVPIIAHPERYIKFIKKPSLINDFIKEGFLFQLNIGSLLGHFGTEVKKLAESYLKNKVYSAIGSDGHRDEKRTTNMKEGIKIIEKLDADYLRYLNKSGEKILENEEISFRGSLIKEKKGIFSIFG